MVFFGLAFGLLLLFLPVLYVMFFGGWLSAHRDFAAFDQAVHDLRPDSLGTIVLDERDSEWGRSLIIDNGEAEREIVIVADKSVTDLQASLENRLAEAGFRFHQAADSIGWSRQPGRIEVGVLA